MLRFIATAALAAALLVPSARAEELGAGQYHVCAVGADKPAYCWGWGEYGQLGTGSTIYSTGTPVHIPQIHDAVDLDGGYQHTCAVMGDGSVKCFGYNRWGQTGPDQYASAPVTMPGVSDAVQVSLGADFSCARLVNGNIKCWGLGVNGQLGHGAYGASDVAVDVQGIDNATSLAAGANFACAVVDGGKVKCWGYNNVGQLGNGGVGPDPGTNVPGDVLGIDSAVAVGAGEKHACALMQAGTVFCWGAGGYGQLGNDNDDDLPFPAGVHFVDDAVALAVGNFHNCVLRAGGTVWCWGYNNEGALGNGKMPAHADQPEAVLGVDGADTVVAGASFSCARVRAEPLNVKCWGQGNFGQLGDGRIGGTVTAGAPVWVQGEAFDTVFGGKPGAFEGP